MTKRKELTVKPFAAEDNLKLHLRKVDQVSFSSHDLETIGKILQARGNGYTFLYESKIIFCGGINVLWPGVGEAWILCDECVTLFVRELYYYCEYFINSIIEEHKLHRVQATPRAAWTPGVHFVEKLGFKREAELRKYGANKEDYYIYARVI